MCVDVLLYTIPDCIVWWLIILTCLSLCVFLDFTAMVLTRVKLLLTNNQKNVKRTIIGIGLLGTGRVSASDLNASRRCSYFQTKFCRQCHYWCLESSTVFFGHFLCALDGSSVFSIWFLTFVLEIISLSNNGWTPKRHFILFLLRYITHLIYTLR